MGTRVEDDEDWLNVSPVRASEEVTVATGKKRQRKLIGLDDILREDHKDSIRKLNSKGSRHVKKVRKPHLYQSTDGESSEEDRRAPDILQGLEIQVKGAVGDEVDVEWGQAAFGSQKQAPNLAEDGEGLIRRTLQKFEEKGEKISFQSLVSSGFLQSWALCGHCDEATLRCIYGQMVYSKDEFVEKSACKLLCELVTRSDKDAVRPYKLDWVPTINDFMDTLRVYGYEEVSVDCELDISNNYHNEAIKDQGPAKNIRSFLEFIIVCFETRSSRYTASVAKRLLVVMARLLLERRLLALARLVQECIVILVDCFVEEEWSASSDYLATSISKLTKETHNAVYLVGALNSSSTRVKFLQQKVALLELTKSLGRRMAPPNAKEVIRTFGSIDLKAKNVDFLNVYNRLVLADYFLWCNEEFKDKISMYKWLHFLKSGSLQIFGGDERPFATRVRNRASFLWQKYEHEDHEEEEALEGVVNEANV